MSKTTLLAIDDDQDILKVLKANLELHGFTLLTADSLASARTILADRKPDLVLLDVVMTKEHSGFEVAEKMNADETLKGIPVIFITGYFIRTGSPRDNETVKKWSNIKYILDKPVKPSLLLDIIKNLK